MSTNSNDIIYDRESMNESLKILNESNGDFRETGMLVKNALELIAQGQNTPTQSANNNFDSTKVKNLMENCNDSIEKTIYNMNNGVYTMEQYISEDKQMSEEMLRKKLEPASVGDSGKPLGSGNPGGSDGLAGTGGPGGTQSQSQPSQPSQPVGPSGETPPSPPSQPEPPSGPGDGVPTQGPNGETPPSPPSQPEPPSGPGDANSSVGPNGETPPSPPSQPTKLTNSNSLNVGPNGETPPSQPEAPSGPSDRSKGGTLIGGVVGLGLGASVVGGTVAVIKKKKENEESEDKNDTLIDAPIKKEEFLED